MTEYYAILHKNSDTDPVDIKYFATENIEQLYSKCLEGFANIDAQAKSPSFRIAIICTKYPEQVVEMSQHLFRAFVPHTPEESYIPPDIIENSFLGDDIKTDFNVHKVINTNAQETQYIHRNSTLCVACFRSDWPYAKQINELILHQILLPLLLYLVPNDFVNDDFITAINDLCEAVSEDNDKLFEYILKECFKWPQKLHDTLCEACANNTPQGLSIFPKDYRFILCLPFDVFETACANAPPYIDRIVRIESEDSLKSRYYDIQLANNNYNLEFNEFVMNEYPGLIISPELDKTNKENNKTFSHNK